jgi:glycosyltransferase involved in cell wall biosynthesis
MRVVFLTAAGPWSGAEVHTVNLATALAKRGHDVVIAELGRSRYAEHSRALPCPVIHLDVGCGTTQGDPLRRLGFRSWLQLLTPLAGDIGILIKGNYELGSFGMEAAARLRFSRYLVIEHLHVPLGRSRRGEHLWGLVRGLGLWRFRKQFSGYVRSLMPHKIICVSKAVARTLKNDYCYRSSKLVAVHSGVDTELFTPNPHYRGISRGTWGIPETALVFGTLGRLSAMKNQSQLINAFSQLCKSLGERDLRLIIVGEGPLRSSLEALAYSKGVGERIVFAGFTTNPERVLPAFDVFCFPSTTGESLGIALLEAMSCGCAPIAADTGGIPEILNNQHLGWLIRSGDESALVSAMLQCTELDHESLKKIAANARERVVSSFNSVERWSEYVSVIESESHEAG